ncbi:DUF1223 domain-containing protein [Palleronia caenipelagi]|uniref:DUF1223 domain-containing protein n=1 Tax=Palleronia caenipelagi TaxID=2489174 RepID=A0A547Q326_9RHOB|nr:DUF1223 domain-containing protein [Palleronia caenipelagi]TRD20782.1 DUF1223 domain-containing protein [Palleronia caenipelagi]
MRLLSRAALLCLALAAPAAHAGDQPVIVELFTSQGCSSCPPADAILAEMAQRDDVLPLSLHVDYWDYIGWADTFADARFTKRQKAYAHRAGDKMVYTPQMIIGGQDVVVGSRPMEIADALSRHLMAEQPVRITVTRRDTRVAIEAKFAAGQQGGQAMMIHLVPFQPSTEVVIERGENAGETISYANVARDWKVIGDWNGEGTWTAEFDHEGPAAVFAQSAGLGAILGAARVD